MLPPQIAIAREAGQAIMDIYRTDFSVRSKDDESPVTAADEKAEEIIEAALGRLTPDIPVIGEEATAAGRQPRFGRRFWLVDPLDGTREFIKRNGEFTVNIGLVEDGRPVLGVVFAPAIDRLFAGAGPGTAILSEQGAPALPISTAAPDPAGLVVVSSRSHRDGPEFDAWLARHKIARQTTAGSSLKLCLVAAGEADVYPRFGPTCEWDICAGHAVLRAAGGEILTDRGEALLYGKPSLLNPNFIAWGVCRQP